MSTTVEQILQPYAEGKSCIILQGRSLYDLELNQQNQIQPLIELLRAQALTNHNLVMVQYSMSTGVTYDLSDLNKTESNNVIRILSELDIKNSSGTKVVGNESEFVNILRALLRLGQQTTQLTLRDGVPLRFLVLIEFSENLLPHVNHGSQTQEQIVAIELAFRLSNSLGFRKSQNYTVLSESRQGLIETLIYQNIPTVNLSQPCLDDKMNFIDALRQRYPNANIEAELSDDVMSNLSSGTPNRSIESIFLTAERTGNPVTAKNVFSKKQTDIISLSEGTLQAIDHNRVKGIEVVGSTVKKPMEVLMRIANGLKTGNKNIPRNIILCGAPSGGKTILTLLAAAKANVPTFTLENSRTMWVGESERKCRLQLNLLRELGGLGLIDEIEMQLPMNRGMQANDSGVTQNIMGQLQSFLADTSLSGKVCMVGTSNRPNAISEAMRQRWIILPVLMPLESDYAAIVYHIAKELNNNISVSENDQKLMGIAQRFYQAGAAPREIREALIASQAILPGVLEIEHLEFASHDIIPNHNKIASELSDYFALSFCRSNSFLPWWDDATNSPNPEFPYPNYIREILTNDNYIDHQKLSARIAQLEPYANV